MASERIPTAKRIQIVHFDEPEVDCIVIKVQLTKTAASKGEDYAIMGMKRGVKGELVQDTTSREPCGHPMELVQYFAEAIRHKTKEKGQ